MRTAGRIALASSAFGALVAAGYWLRTLEVTGTVLLGAFAVAPLLIWGFVRLHRPPSPEPKDRPDATLGEAAGESVGTFSAGSAWPILLAGASMLVAGGLAYGVWLLLPALILFALATVGFVRE